MISSHYIKDALGEIQDKSKPLTATDWIDIIGRAIDIEREDVSRLSMESGEKKDLEF